MVQIFDARAFFKVRYSSLSFPFIVFQLMTLRYISFQLFISLLSEKTIESKYCQDELALAYVSNKPIFPVGLAQPQDLFPKMDTGM